MARGARATCLREGCGGVDIKPLLSRFPKGGQTLQDLSLSTSTEPALNHIRYALAHSLHRAGRDEEARAHMSRVHFTLPSLATGVRQLAAKVRARHGKAES